MRVSDHISYWPSKAQNAIFKLFKNLCVPLPCMAKSESHLSCLRYFRRRELNGREFRWSVLLSDDVSIAQQASQSCTKRRHILRDKNYLSVTSH